MKRPRKRSTAAFANSITHRSNSPVAYQAQKSAWLARAGSVKVRLSGWLVVPGERIELPTNGLQNRCSTAELTRQTNNWGVRMAPLPPYAVAATILLLF